MERIDAYNRCLKTGGREAFCDQCKAKENPDECHLGQPVHAEFWEDEKLPFPKSGRIFFYPKPRDGD